MCGIFGIIANEEYSPKDLQVLCKCAESRGKDSSGFIASNQSSNVIRRDDTKLTNIIGSIPKDSFFVAGHSRLITNGMSDNQPIFRDKLIVLHNGILVNHEDLWDKNPELVREKIVDTEVIPALVGKYLITMDFEEACHETLKSLVGTASFVVVSIELNKIALISNNGSMYYGRKGKNLYFSSESYPLAKTKTLNIRQVKDEVTVFDIKFKKKTVSESSVGRSRPKLISELSLNLSEGRSLQYDQPDLKRCSKCILPESMPFIEFNNAGICNYCENYTLRNQPEDIKKLKEIIEPFKEKPINGSDCIVPFSGGRDSSYALHFIIEELGMKPITYTYDWGMVNDLARRNISRMCSRLGVENIIVAADIEKKRNNINKNFRAWLKKPDLGMVSILTAGDKHFYRHVQTIKKQTGLSLDLWGVNPLEVTHFKAGFLGVPPYFSETNVYNNGLWKQVNYQKLRLQAMSKSLGYFNSSIFDTLSGEYFRSVAPKKNYHHIFDYWRWDEKQIDQTLTQYDWETAPDTNTTWRIGDGTAAMYNYIYYTLAGFTEHDTFRSNQIREGQLTRDEALDLVLDENQPRYQNIKWYLDAVGLPFDEVINTINNAERAYVR
jgi:glutamine---fructose-6-phosphate transaminase (isomerizing)